MSPLCGIRGRPYLDLDGVLDTSGFAEIDMDYHGVEADPFFRYSIRVDGVFDSKWLSALRRRLGG